MGEAYHYTCPSCGYEAYVAGGKSRIMMAKRQSYQCDDCKTVMDISTEIVDPNSESGAWPDFIPVDEIKCFHCGSRNVRVWDGITCPKCGAKMIKGEEGTRMVD